MQIEVYADIVFIINLAMDYFIFWITSKLIRKKAGKLRLVLGSATASALYCALIFVENLRQFYNFFAAVLILMIGIAITFNPKGIKEFIKLLALSHISAFAVGGLGVALFYYTNITGFIGRFIAAGMTNFSVNILIISACTAFVTIKLTSGWIKRVFIKKQTFYTIKIHLENEDLSLSALIDTGNSLSDPVSNTPVIITEFNAVKAFLPDGIKLMFYENREDNLSDLLEHINEKPFASRIRMIPYTSVGRENGMLLGFKPDLVEIYEEAKTIEVSDVLIGIYNRKLSKDGTYQGLLNPEILL